MRACRANSDLGDARGVRIQRAEAVVGVTRGRAKSRSKDLKSRKETESLAVVHVPLFSGWNDSMCLDKSGNSTVNFLNCLSFLLPFLLLPNCSDTIVFAQYDCQRSQQWLARTAEGLLFRHRQLSLPKIIQDPRNHVQTHRRLLRVPSRRLQSRRNHASPEILQRLRPGDRRTRSPPQSRSHGVQR